MKTEIQVAVDSGHSNGIVGAADLTKYNDRFVPNDRFRPFAQIPGSPFSVVYIRLRRESAECRSSL